MNTQKQLKEDFEYHRDGYFIRKYAKVGYKIGDIAGDVRSDGYRRLSWRGKRYLEHHLVWLYHHGEFPAFNIDHINRIPSDNRIENLRLCENNQKDNMQNRGLGSNNKSGYTGVCWCKNEKRWKCYIKLNGKKMHLGTFKQKEDAINKRLEAEKKYFLFGCNNEN
jgi:hypothetical protein